MTEQKQQQMWTILSVVDIPIYSPQTGNVQGKRVSYRLYDGTVSYVDVPASEYTAQKVHDRIQQAASMHKQVMGVEGPPVERSGVVTYQNVSDVGT